jgi:putative SOS response-associated peptidase YedK
LVVVSGFFEWRNIHLPTAKKPVKVPYYIRVKNEAYFYMAGIYNNWVDASTGEVLTNFAIVTTEANSIMAQIHNTQLRMPVILLHNEALQWLTETNESEIQKLATYQINSDALIAHIVDREFRTLPEPWLEVEYDIVPALVIN